MNLNEMSAAAARARIDTYGKALEAVWKARPNMETHRRFSNFQNSKRLNRILWIKWVKEQVDHIEWCRELVCEVVTNKLIGKH